MDIISIRDLKKTFGNKVALDISGLDIAEGESVGIVGNNGAGKTTLFRAILDLMKPDQGVVYVGEHDVAGSDHWKKLLHAFIDESFLIDFLKPLEYFYFVGKTVGLSQGQVREQLDSYSEFSNDDITQSKKLIRDLSTGSRVRVGILASFLGDPKVILLDEPFAHLDPGSQARLGKVLRRLNDEGKTIILSSHNLHNITQVSNRIILIENGQVVRDKEANESTLNELSSYFEAYEQSA